ncbi:MAG TPA: RcnB family protein [Candidatus Aquabacterium excrementipullorum]|nr:RcnB family protein [Candidatus Aquabacterium excrementipullorum]
MNSNKITIGGVALILGLSTALASAQPRGRDEGGPGGPPAHAQGHGPKDHRPDHPERGRGAGPEHRFYKGDRLPNEWRNRQYVVNDWRAHHLKRPPRGYHWVQTGPDYVLVAITTGVIAQIILSQ